MDVCTKPPDGGWKGQVHLHIIKASHGRGQGGLPKGHQAQVALHRKGGNFNGRIQDISWQLQPYKMKKWHEISGYLL